MTVTACPAMVSVPERTGPGLASALKTMRALPSPLSLVELTCSHGLLAEAVQTAVAGLAARRTLLASATGPSTRFVVPSVKVVAWAKGPDCHRKQNSANVNRWARVFIGPGARASTSFAQESMKLWRVDLGQTSTTPMRNATYNQSCEILDLTLFPRILRDFRNKGGFQSNQM